MDAERARELLQAERERIERALGGLGHEDDSEPADEYDPGNLASDLYQDELDEGLEEDLREQLAAVEPLVHAPEGVDPASVGGVRVVDDAVLEREGAHPRRLTQVSGHVGSRHRREVRDRAFPS